MSWKSSAPGGMQRGSGSRECPEQSTAGERLSMAVQSQQGHLPRVCRAYCGSSPEAFTSSVPVRDRGAEPQEISVAIDASKPPGAIVKLVSDRLIDALQDCLAVARQQGERTAR